MKKTLILFIPLFILSGCGFQNEKKSSPFVEGQGIVSGKAMAVSDHPQSSRIGAEILKSGGNAIDAAVAMGFALAVCYPEAGNIGGGGFMLIRTSDGKTDVLDYREKSPEKSSRDMYLDNKGNVIEGLTSSTLLGSGVPGSVAGLLSAHEKYGKLAFKDIIQPAIDLASNGFPLSGSQAASFNRNRAAFISRNSEKTAFVKDSISA
jgi:gamma-glutamyltranspeptidase / glutathione hydrolase